MRACVLACSKIKLYVKVIYNLQRVYKHYMINRTNFRVDKETKGHLLFSSFFFFFLTENKTLQRKKWFALANKQEININFQALVSTMARYQDSWSFPGGASGKESACQFRRLRRCKFSPWSGRSPGGGNGNYSCILAWKIPWTEQPGRIQSMGSQRVEHNWGTNHK